MPNTLQALILGSFLVLADGVNAVFAQPPQLADARLAAEVRATLSRAADYYVHHCAQHGGYVYHYSLDLAQRWGEGEATRDQIWVQPPGTPTVGMAFLRVWEATGDDRYLTAATRAAEALAYGQISTGGWTNCVDFDPRGRQVAQYRNGKGKGRTTSSLDDGQTQSALRFLMQADHALRFRHKDIHEAVTIGLDALLAAHFPNGGFPQIWDEDPIPSPPVVSARYPDHDWKTEGRIKNYWDLYTLNDNVCGYALDTLIDAVRIYDDPRCRQAIRRLGDFLVLAQMPEPQPGWAQQYNYDMEPVWARRFEPPAVAGDETQETIGTLIRIAAFTGEAKYLDPIPSALAWLKRSQLSDGRLARYYELRTNRPLYMTRRGDDYRLTHDDSDLPGHYGWKWDSRVAELTAAYEAARRDLSAVPVESARQPSAADVRTVIDALDDQGRWVSRFDGTPAIGALKLPVGTPYLSSQTFADNMTLLAAYVHGAADR